MCGIFGISVTQGSSVSLRDARAALDTLFLLSESRGREAAGVALVANGSIRIFKEPVRAKHLVRKAEYDRVFEPVQRKHIPLTIIGHSRLVTTGAQRIAANNQPVIHRGAVGVHNGIVVNHEALWRQHADIPRGGDVDSEVIFGLIRRYLSGSTSLAEATSKAFQEIDGAASTAVVFDDLNQFVLATNTGSLYHCSNDDDGIFIFASERWILETALSKAPLKGRVSPATIEQLRAGAAMLIDLQNLSRTAFALSSPPQNGELVAHLTARRDVVEIEPASKRAESTSPPAIPKFLKRLPSMREIDYDAIDRMRRCTKCILPETMPFIEFDTEGVCNYCRHYKPNVPMGREALEAVMAPIRSKSGQADCLVGVSGGRDSSFGLHFMCNELNMRPIAFTYDWGMVTDLARRNVSRICGKLGVEHILVSADIEKKRRFVRQNLIAWLKTPDLGLIPLLMAGDKQYFFHSLRLQRANRLGVQVMCENMLERTHFKTGYAGIRPWNEDRDHAYTLRQRDKLTLASFYGRRYLANPRFINASLLDTIWAFACYYGIKRDFVNLFRYIEWNEDVVNQTLRSEFDWEVATDTTSTWRIGDGTAAFYNYAYFIVSGFTENDTLRSNQIREGVMDREAALKRVRQENQPRFESIEWYLNTIGLGHAYDDVLRRIAAIPRRYESDRE
ncbi:MAG: hypothetical protein H6818_22160 [Phycisphaerales bacterium]|nr:hypothetical protein [Phycisphaerales bacterium]MCB9862497.1 hypothetical protein [Phycisphaerales bacterium]